MRNTHSSISSLNLTARTWVSLSATLASSSTLPVLLLSGVKAARNLSNLLLPTCNDLGTVQITCFLSLAIYIIPPLTHPFASPCDKGLLGSVCCEEILLKINTSIYESCHPFFEVGMVGDLRLAGDGIVRLAGDGNVRLAGDGGGG
ncbi:hypothetical protein AAC387_Pa02g2751 [Persea americana]